LFIYFFIFKFLIMTNNVRRKSASLDVAKSRWQGLVSQDPVMDLGNGLGVQAYEVSITALNTQLLKVNNLAAELQTERAKLVKWKGK
jgi:hypothetical protein